MRPLLAPSAFARIGQLAAERRVHRAFRYLHLNDGRFLEWQRRIASIPAPPFGEGPRAEWLAEEWRALGLAHVRIDDEGNVLGWLPGRSPNSPGALSVGQHSTVVLSAHIDTVFPAATPIEPRLEGNRLVSPGACDNAAGVTGLLAIAAALLDAGIPLGCDLLMVGNTGEEGEGDLRGMRHLYADDQWRKRVSAHLVLDGAGSEVAVTEALGSRRFLVTIAGPGGHSWTDAGAPNPIAILSHAIAALSTLDLPSAPRTTLNVGTIEGGSSVNAIPERATARFDLRSTDENQMTRLEDELRRAVHDSVARANASAPARAGRRTATCEIEPIGRRPAGKLQENSPLFTALRAVDRHLRIRTETRVASTDANIPLSLGVPAISLGAGGEGGGIHTRGEWYDATHRELALKRILLLTLALAGLCEEQ